jgi:hypothetical protein
MYSVQLNNCISIKVCIIKSGAVILDLLHLTFQQFDIKKSYHLHSKCRASFFSVVCVCV